MAKKFPKYSEPRNGILKLSVKIVVLPTSDWASQPGAALVSVNSYIQS